MANGRPNWWDPVQHWQLAALEETAIQQHQRLENLCIQRFAALEQRVDKVEADLIVAEGAGTGLEATVLQLQAQVQEQANQVNQCHVEIRRL